MAKKAAQPATAETAPKPVDPNARPMPPVGWTVGFWPNRDKVGEMIPARVMRVNGHQLRLAPDDRRPLVEGVYQHRHPYLAVKPQLAARVRSCWDWIPGHEMARVHDPKVLAAIADAVAAATPPAAPATDSI